jgi:cyanophycinase-like exopeptidase
LIIIGGHEDKSGDQAILTEVAKTTQAHKGGLVIITVASQEPQGCDGCSCTVVEPRGTPQDESCGYHYEAR